MRRGKQVLLAVVVLALMAGLLWMCLGQGIQPEPVYKGKPLSYWLEGFDLGRAPNGSLVPAQPTWTEAQDALRKMGTKALPGLMRMMGRRDSRIKEFIIDHLEGYRWFQRMHKPELPKIVAVQGFSAVGDGASNAVPELVSLFERDRSAFVQQAVPGVIGDIGPPAIKALPAMMGALAHTNVQVRCNAMYALRRIHAKPEVVVPELIKALKDPDIGVRMQAIAGLRDFGPDASNAVPALIELIQREPPLANNASATSSGVRQAGVINWAIGGDWPSSGGVGSTTPDPRGEGIQALRAIEPEAANKLNLKSEE